MYLSRSSQKYNLGFTLIELVAVLVIVGVLAAIVVPKFFNLSSAAKVATLQSIKGTMESTAHLVRAGALAKGLKIADSNPGVSQSDYIIELDTGETSEVDWRNLCPESQAELGDRLTMVDFINLTERGELKTQLNNRWTLVGYKIPAGFSIPTDEGCYLAYDSFGDPECTVTIVTVDC